MAHRWYYQLLLEEFGPVTASAIHDLKKDGTLGSSDLVRREDSTEWIPVAQMPPAVEVNSASHGLEEIADLDELSFSFEEASISPRRSVTSSSPTESQTVAPSVASVPTQVAENPVKAGVTYYCKSLGQVLGPMTINDLIGMAESGALSQDDFVRHGDVGPWQIASEVPELAVSILQYTNSPEVLPAPDVPVRRLFQTAGRPKSDTASDEHRKTEPTAENTELPVAPTPQTPTARDTSAKSEINAEVTTAAEPAKLPNAEKTGKSASAGVKKQNAKRRMKQKADKAEDALLTEIFGEVFADDSKSTHPGMPAAATGPAPTPATTNTRTRGNSGKKRADESTDEGSKLTAPATAAPAAGTVAAVGVPIETESGSSVAQASAAAPQSAAAAAELTTPRPSSPIATESAASGSTSESGSASPSASTSAMGSAPGSATPAPAQVAGTVSAAAMPSVPPKASRRFRFEGPVRTITLTVLALAVVGGLITVFGLPSLSFNSAGKHAERMTAVAAEVRALGDTPSLGQWEALCLKSRAEFVPLYKGMLESNASGPANVACMEGMKAIIAIASTKPEETERRKELLKNLDKALADLAK